MKAKAMHPEDEKALSQMIENGYVLKDEVHWEDPNEVNAKVDFIKESISKGAARSHIGGG